MSNTTPNSSDTSSDNSGDTTGDHADEIAENQADQRETLVERYAEVPEELAGQRYDQIAAKLFPEFSRGKLQSWIQSGELTANEQQCKPRQKLFTGTQLKLKAAFTQVSEWVAEHKAINIVFEDDHILVINKAANCVVHPAPGLESGTLVNSVLAHCPDNSGLPRGGIVHRLDKDTTGLMVVAKSLQAHTSLVRQLQERTVKRIYRAIARGTFISGGTVDEPIGRHPTARTKMAVAKSTNNGAKHAITHYRIAERFAQHTELTVKLETGRTHQIRVHMAHLRRPLVGDKTYSPRYKQVAGISEDLSKQLMAFPRQALHAFQLSFEHPLSQELCSFECELPQDYENLLNALRSEGQTAAK